MDYPLSIILPAKNEAGNLGPVLAQLAARFPTAEILVVDDGSTDATARIARAQGARVVSHPYSLGNGAAVKTGARHATGEVLVFLDADGQHDPADIARLLAKLDEGYERVVGARQVDTHASLGRRLANHGYNRLASWMTGLPETSSLKSSEAFHQHRTEIRSIVTSNRVTNPRVFGSVLHARDREGSDLDIVVDPTSETTLLDIARIKSTLENLLGVRVDVLTPKALPERFRNRVLAEAEPV